MCIFDAIMFRQVVLVINVTKLYCIGRLMSEYSFKLIWPNPPRTTTRSEWKAANRWLRECRKVVEKELDRLNIHEKIIDSIIYGTPVEII